MHDKVFCWILWWICRRTVHFRNGQINGTRANGPRIVGTDWGAVSSIIGNSNLVDYGSQFDTTSMGWSLFTILWFPSLTGGNFTTALPPTISIARWILVSFDRCYLHLNKNARQSTVVLPDFDETRQDMTPTCNIHMITTNLTCSYTLSYRHVLTQTAGLEGGQCATLSPSGVVLSHGRTTGALGKPLAGHTEFRRWLSIGAGWKV
jgi:hypothetical protein